MDIRKTLIEGFKSGRLNGKSPVEIPRALKLSPSYKKIIKSALRQLENDGIIFRDFSGRYSTPENSGAFRATVKANPQGYAFLIPEGKAEREHDYFVPKKHLNGALDGDSVQAVPVRGTEDEARILKILERGRKTVCGILQVERHAAYVLPDDRAYCSDVYIPLSLLGGAADGDKVVAEITSYPKGKPVGGKIIEILGRSGDLETEELSIIRSYNLRGEFPQYVEETAEKVAAEKIELDGRADLRGLLTITIDGDDTRDIDDAVSLEVKDGNYILGVHIADVSHYVKAGGCIDKEAYERGTSVYFPDRVLPMLPRALSNGACSLNEGEDRYATSCIMTFSKDGKRLKYELCESVIKSDAAISYNKVTSILDGDEETREKYKQFVPMIEGMKELCLALEAKRKAAGEVSLDVKEAHIYLNERGEITIPDYERALSHRMIEQFMVSANEVVAEFAAQRKAPFLYRIHEKPSPEKAENLYAFLRDLGINAKGDTENASPADYQRILNEVEDKPFATVVNKVMLRSMQKARYSEENKGHFGLASACYCHFTSPIRRYPDLFVHRVLKYLLRGDITGATEKFGRNASTAATDASERERVADSVERDVDDLYKLFYMSEHIGEEYEAVVSGVIESGIFAELANTVEGMIRYDDLPRDSYEYYAEKFLLKGTRNSFRIGDRIKIKVAGCDLQTRRINFILA